MTQAIAPENVGDIYEVRGYPHAGKLSYGVAHTGPSDTLGHWAWWLQMDDGDDYPWVEGVGPQMPYESIAVYRRNPLPEAAS